VPHASGADHVAQGSQTPDAAKSENEEVDEMKRRLAELEELVSKLGPKKAARKKNPATRRRPRQVP
jgi:hypothetical protein